MAKNISNGIEQMQKAQDKKQSELTSKQWQELRNRIDSILLSNNVMKSNEVRQQCLAIDGQNQEEREAHILKHWGPLYLAKVQPLLQQLQTLEATIFKCEEK